MSNKKDNIITSVYKTYGEALKAIINYKKKENGEYSQSKLAENINTQPNQVNRWINKGVTPVERTRLDIERETGFEIEHKNGEWTVNEIDQDQSNVPEVQYADSVEIPEDGKLSRDHVKQLLGQIEEIARILKDSL